MNNETPTPTPTHASNLTWHPDTNMTQFKQTNYPIIERAQGFYMHTTDGRKLLDGISSWWCVSLGHSRSEIVERMINSLRTKQHVILGGMAHPSVIELSQKLANITPGTLNHSFYASDGASAVEAALRMAIQYWTNIGVQGKNRFIALQDAYHGDTMGAIGVGFLESFHEPLAEVVNRAHVAESPNCLQCPHGQQPKTCNVECFHSMKQIVTKYHSEVAAIIIEPMVQGAGGVKISPAKYMTKLRKVCDDYNILLIADEIAVGFYRTGELFACNHSNVVPDILVLGKALTAGHAPMSVAIANERVYNSFENKIFWHSHTFGGYPSACEAALAVLDIYKKDDIYSTVKGNGKELRRIIHHCAQRLGVAHETIGMVGMMKLSIAEKGGCMAKAVQRGERASELAKVFTNAMVEAGVFVRPLGDVVYLWAPLTIEAREFDLIQHALNKGVEAIESFGHS